MLRNRRVLSTGCFAGGGLRRALVAMIVLLGTAPALGADDRDGSVEEGFERLFPDDGDLRGWLVRRWDDVSKPADPGVEWKVIDGVLHGSQRRGTWLISQRQYGDFILKFEFRLGPRGNSGLALRAPLFGDPAFDGMELQMADWRYNTQARPAELTGGIYRAIAPRKQVYRPTEWNRYEIELVGDRLRVRLNGQLIHDLDLAEQDQAVQRHDGSDAPPINQRPRRGHLGFQELSRGGDHVQIRNARIRVLDAGLPERNRPSKGRHDKE